MSRVLKGSCDDKVEDVEEDVDDDENDDEYDDDDLEKAEVDSFMSNGKCHIPDDDEKEDKRGGDNDATDDIDIDALQLGGSKKISSSSKNMSVLFVSERINVGIDDSYLYLYSSLSS